MRRLCFVAGLVLAGGLAVAAGFLPAKQWLAARLIVSSWERMLAGDEHAQPWPWLRSVPVARVEIPRLAKNFVVMEGTSGEVLAFAPGWHQGSAFPGMPGISLIAAPGATHFGFLRALQPGDAVVLHMSDGGKTTYEIETVRIMTEDNLQIGRTNDGENVLLLAAGFSFVNGRPGEEMKMVAVARQRVIGILRVSDMKRASALAQEKISA